jgi:hypothetical protein
VVKHVKNKRVVEITRKASRGTSEKAKELLLQVKGCNEFNTAFIERLNDTFRERLASLIRKCRHAAARVETLEMGMYLIGCTYNFCWPHQERSKQVHFAGPTTPAMAAALTDQGFRLRERLCYKVAPAPWVPPTPAKPRRERAHPPTATEGGPTLPKRPRGRPPKYVLAEVVAAARTAGAFTS